jgi:hypothetical protein
MRSRPLQPKATHRTSHHSGDRRGRGEAMVAAAPLARIADSHRGIERQSVHVVAQRGKQAVQLVSHWETSSSVERADRSGSSR